jgi:hypothetical protein
VTPRPTAICAQVVGTSRAASGTTCGHIGGQHGLHRGGGFGQVVGYGDGGAPGGRRRRRHRRAGPPHPRRGALLPHNALRVDEACSAGLADLSEDSGHRVLTVLGKGNRKAKIPLTRVPAGRWTPR